MGGRWPASPTCWRLERSGRGAARGGGDGARPGLGAPPRPTRRSRPRGELAVDARGDLVHDRGVGEAGDLHLRDLLLRERPRGRRASGCRLVRRRVGRTGVFFTRARFGRRARVPRVRRVRALVPVRDARGPRGSGGVVLVVRAAHRSRYTGWFSSATSIAFSGSEAPGLATARAARSLARGRFPRPRRCSARPRRRDGAGARSRSAPPPPRARAASPPREPPPRPPPGRGRGPRERRRRETRDVSGNRAVEKPTETTGNDRERAERETPGRVATGAARAAARGDDANMRGEQGGLRSASATCEGERRGRRDATSEATTKAVNCLGRVESK